MDKSCVIPNVLYLHGGGDTIGGIETFLTDCMKHHKEINPYLGIFKKGKFWKYLKEFKVNNLLELKGGRYREFYKSVNAIYQAIKFIKENDVKIVISHGLYSWFLGSFISKIAKVKSVFYVHGEIKRSEINRLPWCIPLKFKPTMYIANSKFTAESIKRNIKPICPIKVNYPGIDSQKFEKIDEEYAKSEIKKIFNIPRDKLVFVMIGRIQEWKGQDVGILAFKNMKNKDKACLLIVGECTFKKD
ncbi:MAG: glycosyltransferase, partial [Candidatus Omnitrophica bacterium]|nr:glycosyltransferase [Candidatus Omnitrophota bacterium]